LTFKESAQSKVGSMDYVQHKPGGGDKKVTLSAPGAVLRESRGPVPVRSAFPPFPFLCWPQSEIFVQCTIAHME